MAWTKQTGNRPLWLKVVSGETTWDTASTLWDLDSDAGTITRWDVVYASGTWTKQTANTPTWTKQ